MAKRRANGEGGVRLRPDGRWEARLNVGWGPTGKRRRKYVYGRTRNEVIDKLRREMRALGEGRPPLDERLRVGEFLDRWLEGTVKPRRSHGHWRNCEAAVRLHINP